jgi:cytochrome c biogenesis protein
LGSSIGAFNNFKAQEILPKGELFHIQNPIKVGWFTNIPNITLRVNDFWVEYEKNKIHQFYSNLSILDNLGNEMKEKTISVNNPLKYKNIDFYQSDWNVIALRVKNVETNNNYEIPVFSLKPNVKSWITWIQDKNENYTIIFDQLQNTYLIYNSKGEFLNVKNSNEMISPTIKLLEIVPSTGLLIKYDPSIPLIYFGFGLLMITTIFSYLPYTQLWIVNKSKKSWIGALTNRGKIQLEIEFENLTRSIEKMIKKSNYLNDSN